MLLDHTRYGCVSRTQVTLSFSGTGEAAFAGVGLFAHPDVACRCEAGYYLDVASAPVRSPENSPNIQWLGVANSINNSRKLEMAIYMKLYCTYFITVLQVWYTLTAYGG